MFELTSQRLRLIPLNTRQLILFKKDRKSMQLALGLNPSDFDMDEDFAKEMVDAYDIWIDKSMANPDHYRWFTNWVIVHTELNQEIGGIGISGLPDENGEIITGYYIDNRFHNRGIATEALQMFLQWLWENPDLRTVVADTPLEHWASQKVLQKNGFQERKRDHEVVRWALGRR